MSPATNKVTTPHVALIGGGNMSEAIFSGLLAANHPASHISIAEPWAERVAYLTTTYPDVSVYTSNDDAIEGADIVILAVKPQVAATVVRGFAPRFRTLDPILLSVAAGIRLEDIERWMYQALPATGAWRPILVRCMPNTPALVGEGAIGVYGDPERVSRESRAIVQRVLSTVAPVLEWTETEALLDAVTGTSGSGPAYFFLLMEAMEAQAIADGLPPQVAKRLITQTCLGAARMSTGKDSFAQLRVKVTSPNGTTAAALDTMTDAGLPAIVSKAVSNATRRATEMGLEFGQQ